MPSPVTTHCSITAVLIQLGPYSRFESEVKLGNSRIDFLLERPNSLISSSNGPLNGRARPSGKVFLEVKSVTLSEPHHGISGVTIALFPDTVGTGYTLRCLIMFMGV